jgi:hypothetical protein
MTDELKDLEKQVEEKADEVAGAVSELSEAFEKKLDETIAAAEEELKLDEAAEKAKSNGFFIHKTANGFEVDTKALEESLTEFGDKIATKINNALDAAAKSFNESVAAAQEKAARKKKVDKLAKMFPYMQEEEIHEIAEQILNGDEELKDIDIASLLPFMSQEDAGALFEKSLEAGDKLYLDCVPYVGEEVLSKLVDRYVSGECQDLRMDGIYPYLSSKDVKRIFYYELRKE